MTRTWLAFAVEALFAFALTSVLLFVFSWATGGPVGMDGVASIATVLFQFGGPVLLLWVLAMAVMIAVRRALPRALVTVAVAFVAAVIAGAVLYAVGYAVGGWVALIGIVATVTGIGFVVAVAVAAPLTRRLFRAGRASSDDAPRT